jgi:hypothetical protein
LLTTNAVDMLIIAETKLDNPFINRQSSRCTLYDAKTYSLHIGYPVGYFGQASHTSHTNF